jgi:hypothetical protein
MPRSGTARVLPEEAGPKHHKRKAGSSDANPMRAKTISPDAILRFAVGCIVVSALAAMAFLVGRKFSFVRGPSFGVGFVYGLFGSGVAAWYSIRTRNLRFCVAALFSVLPLAFWGWVIYEVVHV